MCSGCGASGVCALAVGPVVCVLWLWGQWCVCSGCGASGVAVPVTSPVVVG